jgi:hypothetical protein
LKLVATTKQIKVGIIVMEIRTSDFCIGPYGTAHAAEFAASFVKCGGTHAMLPTEFRNGVADLGMLENRTDLAV